MEQIRQAAVEQVACASSAVTSNVPPHASGQLHLVPKGNGHARELSDKMDQAVKLLAELADQVGTVAPEHKHVFDDARAAITEFGMLVIHAPEGVNGNLTRIVAPMPGVVLRCDRKPGDHVKKGDVVLILDAMKVENPIQAPEKGTIINIRPREGERVAKGSVLAIIKH